MLDLGNARSFLYQLLTYAPRENRTAREDFFTEALAGYLKCVPEALNAILKTRAETATLPETLWGAGDNLSFETQAGWEGGGRPDIVVSSGEEKVLIIECKIGAPFTQTVCKESPGETVSQIEKYCGHIRHNHGRARVVVFSIISRDAEVRATLSPEHIDIYGGNLTWGEVHRALKEVESEKEPLGAILGALLVNLMEDMGMTEPSRITQDAGKAYGLYSGTIVSMDRMVKEVTSRLQPKWRFEMQNFESRSPVYRCQNVGFANVLTIGFTVLLNTSETNAVRPCFYIGHDCKNTVLASTTLHDEKLNGALDRSSYGQWKGVSIFPGDDVMKQFNEATDWKGQVDVVVEFMDRLLDKLKAAGAIA